MSSIHSSGLGGNLNTEELTNLQNKTTLLTNDLKKVNTAIFNDGVDVDDVQFFTDSSLVRIHYEVDLSNVIFPGDTILVENFTNFMGINRSNFNGERTVVNVDNKSLDFYTGDGSTASLPLIFYITDGFTFKKRQIEYVLRRDLSGITTGGGAISIVNTDSLKSSNANGVGLSNCIALGNDAGNNSQSNFAIAIGHNAGNLGQGQQSLAIGSFSGRTNQKDFSIGIGANSGNLNQGLRSIALGTWAGSLNQGDKSIAIGNDAATSLQGINSIAIGSSAGKNNQGNYSIALGERAGFNDMCANTIILNASGNQLDGSNNSGFYVAPIRNSSGSNALFYDATTKEITYDTATSGGGDIIDSSINTLTNSVVEVNGKISIIDNSINILTSSGNDSGTTQSGTSGLKSYNSGTPNSTGGIAIGLSAASVSQGTNDVAIGTNAGQRQELTGNVAIGYNAGRKQLGYCTAIGIGCGITEQDIGSVAIGIESGKRQHQRALAIGINCATGTQGHSAIAIGAVCGINQSSYAIAIGDGSGSSGTQRDKSIAIGYLAGRVNQQHSSISIGDEAGRDNQARDSIAIGAFSGRTSQRTQSISIGRLSGETSQKERCVAIGYLAGRLNQKEGSISIGYEAGYNIQGTNSIAIGTRAGYTDMCDNTIILNASGSQLNASNNSGFYVEPVRDVDLSANTIQLMMYNSNTKEIIRSNTLPANVYAYTSIKDIDILYFRFGVAGSSKATISVTPDNTMRLSNQVILADRLLGCETLQLKDYSNDVNLLMSVDNQRIKCVDASSNSLVSIMVSDVVDASGTSLLGQPGPQGPQGPPGALPSNWIIDGNDEIRNSFNANMRFEIRSGGIDIGNPGNTANILLGENFAIMQPGSSIGAVLLRGADGSDRLRVANTETRCYTNFRVDGTFTNPSDRRVKTNIQTANYDLAYNKIYNTPMRSFNYKTLHGDISINYGIVADELEVEFPEMVNINYEISGTPVNSLFKDASNNPIYDLKTVNVVGMLQVLFSAFKSAQHKITSLEQRISDLEAN